MVVANSLLKCYLELTNGQFTIVLPWSMLRNYWERSVEGVCEDICVYKPQDKVIQPIVLVAREVRG